MIAKSDPDLVVATLEDSFFIGAPLYECVPDVAGTLTTTILVFGPDHVGWGHLHFSRWESDPT